jgi:hypothetical protein
MYERGKKKKNISLAVSGEILEFSNFASKIWSLNDVTLVVTLAPYKCKVIIFMEVTK